MTDPRSAVLAPWLAERLGAPSVSLGGLTRAKEGNSNETLLFDAGWEGADGPRHEEFVLRVQPTGDTLFRRPDVVREAAVLRHVAAVSDLPVPDVLAVEPDAAVLGSPFFVMHRLPGRVLVDVPSCHTHGWLTGAAPQERAGHWANGLAVLAGLSRVPAPQGVQPAGPGTPLARLLMQVRAEADWAVRGRDLGTVNQALDWLAAHVPDHDDAVLSWGDARPGNLLYHPDGQVSGILDWELAAAAPAEVDLGWWLVTDEFYSSGLGAQRLPGVPQPADQVGIWESLVGRPARDLLFYEVLAAVRFALVLVRSRDRNVAAGRSQESSRMHTHNPMTQLLAGRLGLPVPGLAPEFEALLARYAQKRVVEDGAAIQH